MQPNSCGKDAAIIRTEQDEIAARAAVGQLLRKPLTAEVAVQVALLNNRGLQAAYNELGISEAALVGAYLPPNPTISIERLASGAERELEWRIIGNILALLTLPARAQIAEAAFSRLNYGRSRRPYVSHEMRGERTTEPWLRARCRFPRRSQKPQQRQRHNWRVDLAKPVQ